MSNLRAAPAPIAALALFLAPGLSFAQDTQASPPPPAPAPYSLPWQLRPAQPVSVVRLESTLDFASGQEGATDAGSTSAVVMLLGAYKLVPQLSIVGRLGMVTVDPQSSMASGGTSIVNPVLGATYGLTIAEQFRLAFWLGLTAPVGGGGGDSPSAGAAAATATGFINRSMLDNAMFAVNYFTIFPGVDFAWVSHGLTVQAEVTLLELIRVRGPDTMGMNDLDGARTNFTMGLHVGYFFIPQLSVGAEIRQQIWLSVEDFVGSSPRANQTSWAAGVRAHFKLSPTMVLHPGIAFAMGIDAPMGGGTGGNRDHIVQVDVPFNF